MQQYCRRYSQSSLLNENVRHIAGCIECVNYFSLNNRRQTKVVTNMFIEACMFSFMCEHITQKNGIMSNSFTVDISH
jgi:hypothetical protein